MEITEGLISEVAYNLYKKCLTTERKDVVEAFKKAYERETNSISKVQIRVLLDCIEEAEKKGVCRCQDTGSPQFFVTIGSDLGVKVDIGKALTEATAKAAADLPMRDNVFHPLTHEWKPGGNTDGGCRSFGGTISQALTTLRSWQPQGVEAAAYLGLARLSCQTPHRNQKR